jgi:hypothetical protein
VQVLARKALYQAALPRIDAVIEEAAALEALHELLKALRIKRQLLEILNQPSTQVARDEALTTFAIDGLAESSRYEAIFSEMNAVRGLPMAARPQALDKVAEQLALAMPPVMIRNQIKRWRILYASARMMGKHEECRQSCLLTVSALDHTPALMGDPDLRQEYFSNLHFLILMDIESKEFVLAEKKLARLELIAKKWIGGLKSDPVVHGRFLQSKLSLLLMNKDWSAVKSHLKGMLAEIDKPGRRLIIMHKPAWHRTTLLASFLIGNYRAVKWLCFELKKIIVSPKTEQPFASAIAFYRIAISLEEGQDDLAEVIRREREWLSLADCLGEYEEDYLSSFEKIREEATPSEIASILVEMRSKINGQFKNPLMWQHKHIFPILEWTESRINKVDIKGLVFK